MQIVRFTRKESLGKAQRNWLHDYHWETYIADGSRATEEWKAANVGENGWIKLDFVDTEWFYHQLLALPETAKEEDIIALIGDNNFARSVLESLVCDECNQKVEIMVSFDSECSECGGTHICLNCLNKATQLLKGFEL
jgi:hypothetical protein